MEFRIIWQAKSFLAQCFHPQSIMFYASRIISPFKNWLIIMLVQWSTQKHTNITKRFCSELNPSKYKSDKLICAYVIHLSGTKWTEPNVEWTEERKNNHFHQMKQMINYFGVLFSTKTKKKINEYLGVCMCVPYSLIAFATSFFASCLAYSLFFAVDLYEKTILYDFVQR